MKVVTNIIKFIIIAIISISIVLLFVLNTTSSTVMSKNYVISKLQETNFYDKIHEDLKSNFENYIYQSGLDEEVIENICSKEKLEKDVNIIITNIYDGTEQKIDTTEISDNLRKNIEDSLGKRASANTNAINQFIETICDEYEDTIFHTQYEKQVNGYLVKIQKVIDIAKKGLIIEVIVLFIVLLALNIKNIIKFINDIGITLLSSGMFVLICNFIINSKVKIENIKILSDAFSTVLINIIKEFLGNISKYGVIMLIVGIIVIIITDIINSTKEEKMQKANSRR